MLNYTKLLHPLIVCCDSFKSITECNEKVMLDHAFKYTSYAYDFKGYYYGFPVTVYNLLKVGKKCGLAGLTGYSLGLTGTHAHAYT